MLRSKEWSLGRTSKNPVVSMFKVSLREKSFVFTRTGITSPAFFFKKTPVCAAFSIFVDENNVPILQRSHRPRDNELNLAVHPTHIDICTITLCLWAGYTQKTNSSFRFGMKCVDELFKCAIFRKPRNKLYFIWNRIGEAFLACFGG